MPCDESHLTSHGAPISQWPAYKCELVNGKSGLGCVSVIVRCGGRLSVLASVSVGSQPSAPVCVSA